MTSVANAGPSFGERYTVERELGRGGMATVYLCTDTKFGRPVAIKLLHHDLAAAVGAERFHREIKIATGLTHPNILPAYDSGEADGSLYYVMPYVAGESLRDRITREKQLAVDDTVRIITEVATALQFAHEHGIVHRDIKPENILLESGVAVVADFGIARAITNASEAEALTQTGVSIGTPTYMSPEQAVGEKGVDGRSDQYALACVMYEMLAGHPPFQASTLQGMIMKHISEPVPLVTTVRPSVPDELEDIVLRALEKVPADRFPTIGDFSASLNSVVAHTGTWARRTPTRTLQATRRHVAVQPQPAPRWRKIAIGATAVVAAAAVGIGAYAFLKGGPRVNAADLGRAREIAVLYLDDESRDKALASIAAGVTEEVIEKLRLVPELRVRSRDGVRPFRSSALAADSIGRALKVGTIIRGSVEGTAQKGSLTVRLYDVESKSDLERKTFDFDSTNAVFLADSVALFFREKFGAEISLRELKSTARNPQAWTLALRGESRGRDGDSLAAAGALPAALIAFTEADSLLAQAENADPEWVKPAILRASVALTRAQAQRQDLASLPATIDSGLARVGRALARDARNADALEVAGKLHWFAFSQRVKANPDEHQRELVQAESLLTAATQINRNQAGAWDELSALYYRKPDLSLVINAAREAYRADSYLRSTRSILNRLFLASYNQELWVEAMGWLNEFKARFPQDRYWAEGRLYMYRGAGAGTVNIDSAWTLLEDYVRLTPDAGKPLARKKGEMHVAGALANAAVQDPSRTKQLQDSARSVLLRARDNSAQIDPRRELSAIEAAVRVMLGDRDVAVDRLKDYLAVNPDHRPGFASRIGWWWRGLQDYPPFQALIRPR